jgi:O-acetyl-ADP-ribose deacetylase (regulator of RNase III)
MINTIKGNVLDTENCIIAHCVNCQGVMGGGIAREIRQRFPNVYQRYRADYERGLLQLGYVSCVPAGASQDNKMIANCAGQDDFGTHKIQANYDAIRYCFNELNFALEYYFMQSNSSLKLDLNFPLFGCGLAGGDWNIVSKIIDEEVSDVFNKNLYVL